jgi:hypothetical protein
MWRLLTGEQVLSISGFRGRSYFDSYIGEDGTGNHLFRSLSEVKGGFNKEKWWLK